MLDDPATAERLRKALAEAYEAWNKLDPQNNTKARLARECTRIEGRTCTPQAVSGWFKTGRMDKSWLRAVELTLGRSLGFSATHSRTIPTVLNAFQAAGLHPWSVEWQTSPDAIPTVIRDALPGKLYVPDFALTLADGERLYVGVQTKAEPLHEQTTLLLLQKAMPEVFRVLGHKAGSLFDEVKAFAQEVGPRLKPVASALAPREQLSIGGLDWLNDDVERALIEAYREILPEDRAAAVKELLAKGAEAKRYRDYFRQEVSAKSAVPDGALEHLRAPAHEPPPPRGYKAPLTSKKASHPMKRKTR